MWQADFLVGRHTAGVTGRLLVATCTRGPEEVYILDYIRNEVTIAAWSYPAVKSFP